MERIGVIGLGRMGSAIAQRMQNAGYKVQGWTRSGRDIAGITRVPDLATLAAQSDTLILSLFDDTAVAQVIDSLLSGDLSGKQIIETSTVVPTILSDRIAAIENKGATAVDAPISGGPELVLSGGCGVFVGGSDQAAARASATLAGISGRVMHVGPLGTGLVMKTINNGMLQCYLNGLAELLPLAKRSGLPFETAIEILLGGPAALIMLKDRLPKILGHDDTVGFTINAAKKDNDVFQRVLASYGLDAGSLANSGQRQQAAIKAGLGEDDPAALVRFSYDAE